MSPPSPLSNTPIGRPSTARTYPAPTRPSAFLRYRRVERRNAGGATGGCGPAETVGDGGADTGVRGWDGQQDVQTTPVGLPQTLVEALGIGLRPARRRKGIDAVRQVADPLGRQQADLEALAEQLPGSGGHGVGGQHLDAGLGGVVRRQRSRRRHGVGGGAGPGARRCAGRPAAAGASPRATAVTSTR